MCVCVCVLVAELTATYLIYTLKVRAFSALLNVCIVWILLKTLCSKVLARLAVYNRWTGLVDWTTGLTDFHLKHIKLKAP